MIVRTIIILSFFSIVNLYSQSVYSERGHWIGGRVGYVPTGPSEGLAGILMYEYKFDTWWSSQCDLSAIQFPSGLSFILGAALRWRIPFGKANKNIYGLVGFGSGSMFPVLYAGTGIEYGFAKRIAGVFQYRIYTPNFDHLQPHYGIYSIGVNIDITSSQFRESYLMEKQ